VCPFTPSASALSNSDGLETTTPLSAVAGSRDSRRGETVFADRAAQVTSDAVVTIRSMPEEDADTQERSVRLIDLADPL
jgi:hypothetical protein